MLVSVIVPSHARSEKLAVLLRALAKQELPTGVELETVIALDGDADPAPPPAGLDVQILRVGRVGICAAKNAAVEASRGELLVFVNDDVEPAPRFIAEHVAAQRTIADAGPVAVLGSSPWKRHADATVMDELIARTRMVFFYEGLVDGHDYDFRHAWNLNLSIRRDRLAALAGPFAEELRPVYYDDIELAFRLMGDAPRVRYHAAAVAVHDHRYSVRGYLQREALLGVMATVLHEVNPACYAAIFGDPPAEIMEAALPALRLDARDHARAAVHLLHRCAEPWRGDDTLIPTLELLQVTVKRRAFRVGMRAALDQPDRPWPERPALAAEALAADPAFAPLHEVSPCLAR